MRRTMILAFSAGVLIACGSAGGAAGGERRPGGGAGDPRQEEARSGAPGQPAAEAVPFGPQSEERRRQSPVLRSGSRQRQKVVSDTT